MASVEMTGKTVEEAIERALEELEEARENVEVEVLQDGDPAAGARVRVTLRETYASRAREVVTEMLTRMGIVAQVHVRRVTDPVMVDIAGSDLGILIGWRGETLRAFQTVVNLIMNEGRADRRRIVIDVERYRQRREETVREMALRLAQRVRRTGERVVMDAMPAYERRVVHLTLDKEPGVKTESHGEEPNRRVAIIPDGGRSGRPLPERSMPEATPPLRRPETPAYGDRPRFGERPRYGDRPRYGEPRPDPTEPGDPES